MTHGRVHQDMYDGGLNGCEMNNRKDLSPSFRKESKSSGPWDVAVVWTLP